MVDERAASGKDRRVVHRVDNLYVVEMRDVSKVIQAAANQRPLA